MAKATRSDSLAAQGQAAVKVPSKSPLLAKLSRDKYLLLLCVPGLLYFFIFKYVPMWGVLLAFKNYQPFIGFFDSEWVGFANFQQFFQDPIFSSW